MSGKLPGTWKEVEEDYIPYLKEKKKYREVKFIRNVFIMCAIFCAIFCAIGAFLILSDMNEIKEKEGYIKILAFFLLVALLYGLFMSAKIIHEIGRIKNY